MKAEKLDDSEVEINEFIETALDHCTYSDIKNIKDKSGKKKLNFRKLKSCKINYVNDQNLNNLTLKEFEKKYAKTKITLKKDPKKKTKKKLETKVKNKNSENSVNYKKNLNLSFFWKGMNFPIIAKLTLNTDKSGIITLNLTKYSDICSGTLVFDKNQIGTWSVLCPDNKKRQRKYQKNLSISGKVELLENNQLKGYGLDFYKKEVTFVSSEKIINE